MPTADALFGGAVAGKVAVVELTAQLPSLWGTVVAALIGAVAALAAPIVKDAVVELWFEARDRKRAHQQTARSYLAPLADSCERIIWRMNEIFIDDRHQWLKTTTLPLDYNQYKRQSTMYRIACLLGWIRALSLELSSLPRGRVGFKTPISTAIADIQEALADGPVVERDRLKRLCAVWKIEIGNVPKDVAHRLAVKLEITLYGLAGDQLRKNPSHLDTLSVEDRLTMCESIAATICDDLNRAKLPTSIVAESANAAIDCLSYHEAWIYRDWQDAIGDSVLERDEDSIRRYRIIGYAKFVEVLQTSPLWIAALSRLVTDVDFQILNPNDSRPDQLLSFAKAVSKMLDAVSGSGEKDLVASRALGIGKKLQSLNAKVAS